MLEPAVQKSTLSRYSSRTVAKRALNVGTSHSEKYAFALDSAQGRKARVAYLAIPKSTGSVYNHATVASCALADRLDIPKRTVPRYTSRKVARWVRSWDSKPFRKVRFRDRIWPRSLSAPGQPPG